MMPGSSMHNSGRATGGRSMSISIRYARSSTLIDRADIAGGSQPRPEWTSSGIPDDLREHIRLMLDLLALAFQADATRICTFMFANEGSNRAYHFLNVPDSHHDLSHHAQRSQEAGEAQDDQPIPRRAARLPAREAKVDARS